MPAPGGVPTLLLIKELMKLAPYTVTVLPTYATEGATKVAIGLLLMVSGLPGTAATKSPFVNVNSTEAAPRAVPALDEVGAIHGDGAAHVCDRRRNGGCNRIAADGERRSGQN